MQEERNRPQANQPENWPPPPPPGSRPPSEPPPDRPPAAPPRTVEPENEGTNWLPLVFGGGIALAIICALAFAAYAFFIYQAGGSDGSPAVAGEGVASELEVVKFGEEGAENPQAAAPPERNDAPQPAEQPPVQEQPPAQEQQPAESNEPPAQAEQPTENSEQSAPAEEPAEAQPPQNEVAGPNPGTVPADDLTSIMTSPDYGIHAFLYWRPEVAQRDLQLIEDAGFTWIKQEFAWREIEGAGKGAFNWDNADRMMSQIEKHDLKVLARVGVQPEWAGGGFPEIGPPNNYQDFADFLTALATRYKGRIHAYQIWNEPNLSREWGERPPNPAEYTELLKLSYQAIKAVDPEAIVISAGLAPTTRNDAVAMPDIYFVQGLYDAGAQPYFDMLGAHGAGYKAPPEMDPAEIARNPEFSNRGDHEAGVPEELRRIYGFRHVEDLRAIMVRNGDADKRVAVLEFGWTVDPRPDSPYRWHRVSESREQGEYIVRAFQWAEQNWQPWIGVMILIYMPDPDWTEDNEETYWSIVVPKWPDIWPRPAYYKVQAYLNPQ